MTFAGRCARRRRLLAWILGVLVACGVGGAVVWILTHGPAKGVAPEVFTARAFERARTLTGYMQPAPDLAARISVVHRVEDAVPGSKPEALRDVDVVFVNRVPFYVYWQNPAQDVYVFHPMTYGRVLTRLARDPDIGSYWDQALRYGQALANGGVLWYYPDRYNLSRFLGPDLAPSAIAQGILLGAAVAADRASPSHDSLLARSVFLGLDFDYYRGGPNLADVALLELPLFRSAPEIILNGWLDALLHLHDYVAFYHDAQARELLAGNVRFLARILPSFNDEKTGLSLYSNLCPYFVSVRVAGAQSYSLTAFYQSRVPELADLRFSLSEIAGETHSPYDNQVVTRSETSAEVWVSASQLYETYIVSKDGPFAVEFDSGTYDPYRATPARGGEDVRLESQQVGTYYVVRLNADRDRLFCGYPTNFGKDSGNYYHAYHVVALACLLTSGAVPDELVPELREWMVRWHEAAARVTEGQGLAFAAYQGVLDGIINNGAWTAQTEWSSLYRTACGGVT